jgi:H+-translocating NAD(P) transhydrogenase subunit alpha
MIIGVLREPSPETRISITPETVSALKKKGYAILVENNAGANAFCSNEQFRDSGAEIADRSSVLPKLF